ncbi:MAG: hypothetical protein DI536_27760 [Archangium gephyra]|uniref:Glycosyl transferase family 1 domain-containing protein n=1 Tax=Archangium gephyra TaxID=48 RepID=A0A2W5VBB1_9BACT|nr:MAG: hypothetical protein DI536_27760 [Archangium gephyra]
MKVLHVIYDDVGNPWVGGGGAVRAHRIYEALGSKVLARLLCGAYPGARDDERRRHVGIGGGYRRSRASFIVAAQRALVRERYDAAVIDFSGWSPLFAPSHRPVGLTIHHLTGPNAEKRVGPLAARVVSALERRCVSRARTVSLTARSTEALVRPMLRSDVDVHHVAAGADDRFFSVKRAEKPYFLALGRLDIVHKGLDVLLRAFAHARLPGLELVFAGRGRDGARLESFARELGVERSVRVLGPVSDAQQLELLGHALAVVMPSRFEGFGMAAVEALAAGAPFIATAIPALLEVAEGAGRFVPPEDVNALAQEMITIASDEALRSELSSRSRVAAARFRWSTVAQDHLRFLEAIARSA